MGGDSVPDNSTIGDIDLCVNDSVRTWICLNVRGGRRDCETDNCEDENEWASILECVHIQHCSTGLRLKEVRKSGDTFIRQKEDFSDHDRIIPQGGGGHRARET